MRPLLVCLFFAACSTNANAPTLGGDVDPNARRALEDAGPGAGDAGSPLAPAADAGQTAVPPADPPDCERDEDCPEGDVCRSGECRAMFHGCASTADCHEGAVCATQTGICVETCSEDDECPEHTRCAHIGVCLLECDPDAPAESACPNGTICKENRQAADFSYCGPGEDGARCGPGGTCPAGMGCNPQTGRCDEASACVSDRDCPAHQLCNRTTGRCHDTQGHCGTDRDCPESQICHRVLRRCTPPDYCETHHECPGMEQCHPVLERCMQRCRYDRHCAGEQRCREGWCVEEG